MKRIILALSFLLLSSTERIIGSPSYETYALDTIANGGTGFGNIDPSSATGYTNFSLSGRPLTGTASAIQPDGKIVVVGYYQDASPNKGVIARYNINGTLDTTFNGVGYSVQIGSLSFSTQNNVTLTDVAVQPDGKIVLVGYSTPTAGGTQSLVVARFTPGGIDDTTFNAGGTPGYVSLNLGIYITTNGAGTPTTASTDTANAVALDAYGNIFVTGTTEIIQIVGESGPVSTNDIFVVQYNSSGVLQTSFNSDAAVGGDNEASIVTAPGIGLISMSTDNALAGNGLGIDAVGNLVVVGSSTISSFSNGLVARFTSAGILDDNFAGEGAGLLVTELEGQGETSLSSIGYAVAFQSSNQNNRILVAGTGSGGGLVIGVTNAGAVDNSFGNDFGSGSLTGIGGYYLNLWGSSTTAIAYGIQVQSDDSFVAAGASDTFVSEGPAPVFILNPVLADGSAAISFITTDISAPSYGAGISMQQNGSFVQVGTVGTGNTPIGIARYLGVPVEGAMNYYYNPTGSNPGYSPYPTSSDSADKPEVVAMYPLANGGAYVLTTDPGDYFAQIGVINADGIKGTPVNVYNDMDYIEVYDVIADSQTNAIVVGSTGTYGFIARYINNAGVMTIDTSFGTDGFVVDNLESSTFVRVGQLTTGDYVTIGQVESPTSNAILRSFNATGTAVIDNVISDAIFCDIIIAQDNSMYVAYNNNATGESTGAGNICIVKFLPDGNFNLEFGIDGILNTGLPVSGFANPCLTFDNSGNIVLGSINLDTSAITMQSYEPSAGVEQFAGSILYDASLLVNPILTKLQCDTDSADSFGRLVLTGYDDNNIFVTRMIYNGDGSYILDTSFAPYALNPGILRPQYNTNYGTSVSNTVCISAQGFVFFGGYQNIDNNDTVSFVGEAIGFTGQGPVPMQVPRFPLVASDGTLVNGTPFDLNSSASLVGQPQAMYTFGSGTFNGYTLIATANGTDVSLSMLDATTYALNTSSGGTSFASGAGTLVLPNMMSATSMLVDVDGNIYVLGMDNSSTPLVIITQVNADGTEPVAFYPVLSPVVEVPQFALTQASGMVQQASGRILICGYSESISDIGSGVIVAINPNDISSDSSYVLLDLSFAPNSPVPGCCIPGIFVEQPTPPIMSIAVGETSNQFGDADQIYCTFGIIEGQGEGQSGYAAVIRILENGTQLDPLFNGSGVGFINNVFDPIQMRMQINAVDNVGYVNVVANTVSGIQAVRYDRISGSQNVAPFIVMPSSLSPYLEEMLCLSDGTTLILSESQTDGPTTLDLARLTTAFAADTTFNAGGAVPGVLSTTVPATSASQIDFWAMDVLGNGGAGIIIASDNNATPSAANPYLTQVISSAVVTKYPQTASSTPTPGIVDGTFNAPGVTPGSLNLSTELSDSADLEVAVNFPEAAVAQMLLQVEGGWYYIAGSDDTNTYIAFMSDDDVLQYSGFATNGLLTLENYYGVSSMLVAQSLNPYGDSNGNQIILVAGTGAIINESASPTTSWLVGFDGSTGNILFSSTTNLDSHLALAQQSNGRILIAGDQNGVGAIVAYNSVTGTIDTTFANDGIYSLVDYSAINSILVDGSDNIYVIASNTSEYTQSYVIALNSTATVTNWVSASVTAYSPASSNHVAFDQAGNIVACSANTLGNYIHVQSYSPSDGSLVAYISGGLSGLTNPSITSISIDLNTSPGKIILTGYSQSEGPIPFIIRLMEQSGVFILDTSFYSGSGTPGIVTTSDFGSYFIAAWYDAMINANGKITVAGFGVTEGPNNPYLARFYGDEFIGQYEQPVVAGTPGTLNINFPDTTSTLPAGFLNLPIVPNAQPVAVVPLADGYQYVGYSNGVIIRFTNENIVDVSFGLFNNGRAAQAPAGLESMILDGNGCLVVVGTDAGQGWISRYAYNSPSLDATFNGSEVLFIANCQAANKVIEQSLARLVVAGQLGAENRRPDTNGALFGLTNTGAPDATFAIYSDSGVGVADSGIPFPVHALVADQYDRLLAAGIDSSNDEGVFVGIARLTSSAEYDFSFGSNNDFPGIIFNVLPDPLVNVDPATVEQIQIALDANNNIVVAANTAGGIEIVGYPNATDVTAASIAYFSFGVGEGALLVDATVTGIVATADGKVLLSGYQSDGLQMWVARLVSDQSETPTYILDQSFAPDSIVPGIMLFNIGQDVCTLAPIAMYGTGEITMVGTDTSTDPVSPFMARAYNNPYVPAEPICLDSIAQGYVDQTFGVTNNNGNNGITFWAYDNNGNTQSAKAVGLYDADTIVVALDGAQSESDQSDIYINVFDVDGLLDYSDNEDTLYQEIVLNQFDNQYVNDMVVFTTIDETTKAIMAGYAQNSTPNLTGSVLLCYNIDTIELDNTFGGFNGDMPGVAFGDALALNTVGLQSNGRVITCGLDFNNHGIVLGYTSYGKLDQSFGQGGAFSSNNSQICASVIDQQDKIVVAYNNGSNILAITRVLEDGSGVDATFNSDGTVTTTLALQNGNYSNFGVALDSLGNIIVAAVLANSTSFSLAQYAPNGVLNGDVGTIVTGLSLTDFNITQLLVDQSQAVIVVGYDNTDSNQDEIVVARLVYVDETYVLDSTFNNGAGFVKYAVNNTNDQVSVKALIHPDGRIVITGSQYDNED